MKNLFNNIKMRYPIMPFAVLMLNSCMIKAPRGQAMHLERRNWWRWFAAAGAGIVLAGCVGLMGREPINVNMVGLDPLPGEGMELRMAVKLRVQNPNDTALDYDGIAVELDVRGATFATGVSNERGSIARFGEAIVTVPVSISALAVMRQAIGLSSGESARINYTLRGRMAGAGMGGMRFESSGEFDLPKGLGMK